MVTTYTSKFRLAKTSVGNLDWWKDYWNVMDIVDKHIPRVMMSAPRVLLLTLQAGGSLTASRYYYYKVIAFKDSGATIGTLASWELTRAFTDATNKTIKVNWSAVIDINGVLANKYRVYRYDTGDAGYVPLDSDFLFLAEVSSPTVTYTDNGTVSPGGAMPTTLNWDVTEIKPIHVIRELESTPGAPITIVAASTLADNLTNLRYMIKLLNGETAWNASPYTSFAQLRDGKSGGQTIVGGIIDSQDLNLKANFPGGGTGQIKMNSPVNMLDNIFYGSNIANKDLTLRASSNATNTGTIYLLNNTAVYSGKTLYVYETANVKNVAIWHDGTNGNISSSSGAFIIDAANAIVGILHSGSNNILKVYSSNVAFNISLTHDTTKGTLATGGAGGIVLDAFSGAVTLSHASTICVLNIANATGLLGAITYNATALELSTVAGAPAINLKPASQVIITAPGSASMAPLSIITNTSQPPMILTGVGSSVKVGSLNADQVDGYDFDQPLLVASTPQFAALTLIGTLTSRHIIPSADNTYNLGSATGPTRWANAWITNLYLGDLNLINGWKLDDKTEELIWINPQGKKFRMKLEEMN